MLAGAPVVLIAALLVSHPSPLRPPDPLLFVLPLSSERMENYEVPVVLPRGSYYVQIAFASEFLQRVGNADVRGSIQIVSDTEVLANYDIEERIEWETLAADADVNLKPRNTVLPYPWTTFLPDTVSVPVMPPFRVEERGLLLRIMCKLNLEPEMMQDEYADGIVAVRIDRFIDAI